MTEEIPANAGPMKALVVAFDPHVGAGFWDKTLPYWVSLATVVYGSLVSANVLPDAKWVTVVGMVLAAVNGFFVRHTATPPTA